jgi:cyclophilin family peptidyl-prolyl cis-trans isomerase/HEAT repeat protein
MDQIHCKLFSADLLTRFFKTESKTVKFFMRFYVYVFFITVFFISCGKREEPLNKFSDAVRLNIADFQDRRMTDSLYRFFTHESAIYRADAVQAFGSIQDSTSVDHIGKLLLMDPDTAVRKAAAFSMGQMQNVQCERILLGALMKEKHAGVLSEILDAYGKTTKRWQLDSPAQVDDSARTAGVAWSIYRAGVRNKTDSVATRVAKALLDKSYREEIRMAAAHYFGRASGNFQTAENELIASASTDPSANVRMAASSALGKLSSDTALASVKKIIRADSDSRVVVNAIRSLKSFPFKKTRHYLYEAVNHNDVNVGIAASEVLIQAVTEEDWIEVSALTNQIKNWRIQANVYEAALKAGQNKDLAEEIKQAYSSATDPYQKAGLLYALNSYPAAYAFIQNEITNENAAVVRSTAASALVAMSQDKSVSGKAKANFAQSFTKLMQSEDPAVKGIIASALADPRSDYKAIIKDASFLRQARNNLSLPKDIEALQPIESAIAYFDGTTAPPVKNEFNHPINWELVKTISTRQRATIKTSKGSIIIRLLVDESPGTVSNFVELARKNYFDDKFVHRVVPNFVIQSGCNRGDGWGSEDYSIRSEFGMRRYQTGSMGMASAGKDTEGTQWFITHSPTPHLDGRYTIFAEVIEGMAVVNYLQVGDKVLDVVLDPAP